MAEVKTWSDDENRVTVEAYLNMLAAQLRGERIVKSPVYAEIAAEIGRTPKAVEWKFQNISSALQELDVPWVSGLPPQKNRQVSLIDEVERQFEGSALEEAVRRFLLDPPPAARADMELTVVLPPVAIPLPTRRHPRRPRKTDYLRLQEANRALGRSGEEAVLRHEIASLRAARREDLASKVRHVSEEDGDGLGFDIASFWPDGRERLIEIKTTKLPRESRFYVSRNEVEVSRERADQYSLYRVCDWGTPRPGLYILDGAIPDTCLLTPQTYLAQPRPAHEAFAQPAAG